MTTRNPRYGMSWEQIQERNEAMRHYMDDLATKARFLEQLRAALCDPTYITRRGFDWAHFAREFTAPDFDPPLETWELFPVIREHFAPPGRYEPPRNRIWWIVRIAVGVEDPDRWLLEQREQGGRWAKAVAAQFTEYGVTNMDIIRYTTYVRKRRNKA